MTNLEKNEPNFINSGCLHKLGSIHDMLCMMPSLKQAVELESHLYSTMPFETFSCCIFQRRVFGNAHV